LLTLQEQHLIEEFRKLGASAKDEVISYIVTLARHSGSEAGSSQCAVKTGEQQKPEKNTIFTE
jgi:hypothetical protein